MSDMVATSSGAAALPADALAILPVRQVVLFPGTLQPLAVGRPRSQELEFLAVRKLNPAGGSPK